MDHINIGRLKCACAIGDTRAIGYILTPLPLDDAKLTAMAARHATSLVAISGMSWDHDLTPWPAPASEEGDSDFKGLARDFLPQVLEVVDAVEARYHIACADRTLIGISLSGLFTLWAWTQTDRFARIGTLSGSYWYEGFVEWLDKADKPRRSDIYIAVGDREHESPNAYYSQVEVRTRQVCDALRRSGNRVMFELVPGTHYGSVWPRLDGLLRGLEEMRRQGSGSEA